MQRQELGESLFLFVVAVECIEIGDDSGDFYLRVFETAMREARRVANDSSDSLSPSTQPSMWSSSALPGDERNK